MRRTNKRKNNSKNRRITKNKRFGKRGGVQKECGVCGKWFHEFGTPGAPRDSKDRNLYENHIDTHPICKYCNGHFLDLNTLSQHLQQQHPNKYAVADSIKYGI